MERPIQVPNVATDAIVFRQESREILLITRGREPFVGYHAFPGGFVDYNEDPREACLRELKEECSIEGAEAELVTVAGQPGRDPRKHVISIVYQVKVDGLEQGNLKAADDAATANWYKLEDVMREDFKLAFDHREILQVFLNKNKL